MFKGQPTIYFLIKRLTFLLSLFFWCRILFLIFNLATFKEISGVNIFKSFFFGIRFDITAIVICNLPIIALHLLSFSSILFYNRKWQLFIKIIFCLINIPLLLLNCIDIGLYRFAGKRATADVFKIMSFGDDFKNAGPQMVKDFWYLLLAFILLSYFLIKRYPKIKTNDNKNVSLINRSLAFILILALTVIGFRGGIQYKPINILSASQYGNQKMAALILNTPFTVLKSIGKNELTEVHFMTDEMANKYGSFVHYPSDNNAFQSLNVVIIILESFGKEYIGCLNEGKGYTPFLDSLSRYCVAYPEAYANGKRSIEGIPAIVAGIPALMSEPYITSAYSGNEISGLPNLLKKKNYYSVFFHGGTNGTMGFDNFAHAAGFDRYYGRKEYNNDEDFDGSWGIFDEPFLQRTVQVMNDLPKPFFSTIFTISSHHPYRIPAKYEHVFHEGKLPIHRSVRYTDYSLRKFFESAAKTTWYKNTLFVITADHTALSDEAAYESRTGMYAIPIFYFSPENLKPEKKITTTQQIDILPSVLNYLHYDEPYFAFGNPVLISGEQSFGINYLNDTYQLSTHQNSVIMDPSGNAKWYSIDKDPTMKFENATTDTASIFMTEKLKSFVQRFNYSLIHNSMTYKGSSREYK